MKELARKAYQSSIRAYATHPGQEKKIFNIRKVHTGHLAKAFCLTDTPSQIAQGIHIEEDKSGSSKRPLFSDTAVNKSKKLKVLKSKLDSASEFASGM
jgi:ATP-dependent RNA helicase DDX31/DBP7